MGLIFHPFVRKPFAVEAVRVTEKNMVEIAKIIGRVERTPNGERYIQVDKDKVPNVTKVYSGYWLTRMGRGKRRKLRIYSPKTFKREFAERDVPKTAEIVERVDDVEFSDEDMEEAVKEEVEKVIVGGTN